MAKLKAGPRRSNLSNPLAAATRSSGIRPEVFRDVVMLLYATTGRLQRLRRLVASSVELSAAEYLIVVALYRLGPKSGVRVREIADYLHLAPENVTTAVSKLVSTKWVVKAIDPSDARAVTLRLHSSARKRMDRVTLDLREVNDLWFHELNAAEMQLLKVYLERILNGFDGAYQKAREVFQSAPQPWNDID
jgi:DNA-binding MarR family transcriptional regulator